ncbi:ribonuclease-3 family protein [Gracilibacillus orientalis]|uniref:Mini-ribonuclease 3 n=1 Tax=Gracilibacillus orientalis TaxID=334253 RepID=A0A1I4QKV9_9BACI|nr:ribonuclease III domain-containing protein [Gracilibacillus orientalis]SFM40664.1 ribonuclease-3 family protein [Gracilibacillus orientalis]
MTKQRPKEMKSLALAYMGDVIYEKYVREYLINKGTTKVQHLHQHAVQFVKATSQASVVHHWIDTNQLTTEELAVVKRGRNAKSGSVPKNTSVQAYRHSTAFEALLGFLYLDQQHDRLELLIKQAIDITEKGDGQE